MTSTTARADKRNGRRRPGRPAIPELAARRRREIIATAVRLFVERGYEATTLDDIARELGFTKGIVYHYFRNKAEIVHHAVIDNMKPMLTEHEAIMASALPPEEKLRQVIHDFVHALLLDYQRYLVILIDRAVVRQTEAARQDRLLAREFVQHFRAIIAEGIAAGVFRPVDASVAALTIIQGIIGVARWYQPDGRLSPAAIRDQVTDMLVASLRA